VRITKRRMLCGFVVTRCRLRDGETGGEPTGTPTGEGDTGEGNDAKDGGKKPAIQGEVDPDRAARAIQAAREGEKAAKTAARTAEERLKAVLAAAGPAQQLKAAAEERDRAVAQARQTAVELAVYRSSSGAGADASALLDSRAFLTQVADLDPTAADFGDKVAAAIKAAIKANPKLASGPAVVAPSRQGAAATGAGTGSGRSRDLNSAVARKLAG
jgi:hypothetical protein